MLKLVTLMFASWNQIAERFRQLDVVRRGVEILLD
jgi:hypothetical protein